MNIAQALASLWLFPVLFYTPAMALSFLFKKPIPTQPFTGQAPMLMASYYRHSANNRTPLSHKVSGLTLKIIASWSFFHSHFNSLLSNSHSDTFFVASCLKTQTMTICGHSLASTFNQKLHNLLLSMPSSMSLSLSLRPLPLQTLFIISSTLQRNLASLGLSPKSFNMFSPSWLLPD